MARVREIPRWRTGPADSPLASRTFLTAHILDWQADQGLLPSRPLPADNNFTAAILTSSASRSCSSRPKFLSPQILWLPRCRMPTQPTAGAMCPSGTIESSRRPGRLQGRYELHPLSPKSPIAVTNCLRVACNRLVIHIRVRREVIADLLIHRGK